MTMTTEKDVGIIGGGVGGMVTALLLRKRGCRVTLYEKEARLGGRLAHHEHEEWRIDQGPTIILLPQMIFSILEEAGVAADALPFRLCDPLTRIHFHDGSVFTKFYDEQQQVAEIERLFPGEGENFKAYMRDMKSMYDELKPLFLDRMFARKRTLFQWRNLSALWRAGAYRSVNALANKYFRDARLRHAYSLQTLYIGGAPDKTPGLYSLIPYAEQAFGIWYLQGGYARLAEILTAELVRSGVTVHYKTTIQGLHLEERSCRGVVAENKVHAHDAVVFNGDYPHLEKWLGEQSQDTRRYEPSSGCVLVYLLANRQWRNVTTHQFFLPQNFDLQLDTIFERGRIPQYPAYYVFQPQMMEPELVPDNHTLLYMLIPVPTKTDVEWSVAAPPLVEQVLQDLERRAMPDLRTSIVWRDIRTPHDAQTFGLYGGGSFGIAPTLFQSGMFRPQIKHRHIEGLYAVGASVHPGGGIPIVMQGAMLLTQHLAKEMGL